MTNLNPLLLVGGVIGTVTAILIFAYALVKGKKECCRRMTASAFVSFAPTALAARR